MESRQVKPRGPADASGDRIAARRRANLRYEWSSARPALERLFKNLDEGEEVLEVVRGTFSLEPGYLAVTNRRVVFGMAMPVLPFINRTVKIAHQAVAGVDVEHRPWGASVRVTSRDATPVIGGLEPAEADAIAELIRQHAHLPECPDDRAQNAGDGSRAQPPPSSARALPRRPEMTTAQEPPQRESNAARRSPTPPPAGWYQNPTGPGLRYWNGETWTDSYAPAPPPPDYQTSGEYQHLHPAVEQQGTSGLVIVGYIFAVLMPIVGLILGIIAATRQDPRTKKHGVWIMLTATVAFAIYIALTNTGPSG